MRSLMKIFVIAVLLTGCKSAMKTAYGIKKPKVEDEASIKKFLLSHRVDTSRVYVFKNLYTFATASQNDLLTIPDALFFNEQGKFVPYKEKSTTCNANVGKFISDLNKLDSIAPDPSLTMDTMFAMIRPAGSPVVDKSKINVFLTWTTYAGKLNKDKAFEWVKALDKAKKKGVSVSYYLVNCDFQRSWNLTEEQLKKLGVN